MGKVKGCVNQSCSAKQNKNKYKKTDMYCTKCGQELAFVCPKCYTVLPENSGKYCVRCAEGKKDKKDKTVKAAGAAGGVAAGLVAVAGAALPIIKAIIKKE